jgi:hypothetical protein
MTTTPSIVTIVKGDNNMRHYYWDYGSFIIEMTEDEFYDDYITHYASFVSWVSPASNNVFVTPL